MCSVVGFALLTSSSMFLIAPWICLLLCANWMLSGHPWCSLIVDCGYFVLGLFMGRLCDVLGCSWNSIVFSSIVLDSR